MILETPVFQEPPAAPAAPDLAPAPSTDFFDWYGPNELGLCLWYLSQYACAEHLRRRLARFAAGQQRAPGFNEWVHEWISALRRYPVLQGALGLDDGQTRLLLATPPDAGEPERSAARESAAREQAEPDEWSGIRLLTTSGRDLLATYQVAFDVEACRRREIVSFQPERTVRWVWQLLIHYGPLRLTAVLSLPTGNSARDHQLAWLVEHAPLEVPLRLFYRELGSGRKLLCLERTVWSDHPIDWDRLPAKARALFRRQS